MGAEDHQGGRKHHILPHSNERVYFKEVKDA